MDTIKINVDIHTELSKKEKLNLSKWDVVLKINDTLKGHNITLSIPRNYFKNNSYLITENQEVETVLREVKNKIESFGHKVEQMKTTKLDYPFTFSMTQNENYNSYKNVFEILTQNTALNNYQADEYKPKFDNSRTSTYYFYNNNQKSNSDKKVRIYYQFNKIKDNEKEISLEKNKNLKQRIRIEVENKKRILVTNCNFNLKEIKEDSLNILNELIFKNVLNTKNFLVDELTRKFIKYHKNKNYRLGSFIDKYIYLIFDFEILKEVLKNFYTNKRTLYQNTAKAKKLLKVIEKEKDIYYFDNFKRIEKIRESLLKETEKEC